MFSSLFSLLTNYIFCPLPTTNHFLWLAGYANLCKGCSPLLPEPIFVILILFASWLAYLPSYLLACGMCVQLFFV